MRILLNDKVTLRPLVLVQGETGATVLEFSLPARSVDCGLAALQWQLRATNTQTLAFMAVDLEGVEAEDERFLLPWTVTAPFTLAPGPLRIALCGSAGENLIAKFLIDGVSVAESAEGEAFAGAGTNYFELVLQRMGENASKAANGAAAADEARGTAVAAAGKASQGAANAQAAADSAKIARDEAQKIKDSTAFQYDVQTNRVGFKKGGEADFTYTGNLTGPTGAAGPAGATGPTGLTGPPGKDGTSGGVQAIRAGANITVSMTDPSMPVVNGPATVTQAEAEAGSAATVRGWTAQRVRQAVLGAITSLVYPVGTIYFTTINTNPGARLGGTWVAWGGGRVPVGVSTADTDFAGVEKTGGAKAVALAEPQLPVVKAPIKYNFSQNMTMVGGSEPGFNLVYQDGTNPNTAFTANFGGGLPHNNLQPYITCYMWKRTA